MCVIMKKIYGNLFGIFYICLCAYVKSDLLSNNNKYYVLPYWL